MKLRIRNTEENDVMNRIKLKMKMKLSEKKKSTEYR